MTEDEIIQRYFAPLAGGAAGAFGLTDDAASLTIDNGRGLVVTADMLVAGVHFRADDPGDTVGHKALAVNVSDLAAKGADPRYYVLSLALDAATSQVAWLEAFSQGLAAAQHAFGCHLAGGDTTATPGPAVISIAAFGEAAPGGMVRRGGAEAGDRVYVTGTIGDAALGLRLLSDPQVAGHWELTGDDADWLRQRYLRPMPRVGAIPALRACASAAMDVSDGLMGDLGKLCRESAVGAEIGFRSVPLSGAARRALAADNGLVETIVTGGDDYEILATVAGDKCGEFEHMCRSEGVQVAAIGRISGAEGGVRLEGPDGAPMHLARQSYDHFDGGD